MSMSSEFKTQNKSSMMPNKSSAEAILKANREFLKQNNTR